MRPPRCAPRVPSRVSRAWIWPRSSRTRDAYQWNDGTHRPRAADLLRAQQRLHVVAYDYGIKRNILRLLADQGCRITVVPATTSAGDVLALNPDGVFLSNGPGDPEPCDYAIKAIGELLDDRYAGVRHLPRPSAARAGQRREAPSR